MMDNTIKEGRVTLYNSLGENVYEFSFKPNDMYNSQLILNINSISTGYYTGTIHSNNKSTSFKFIKESN